MNLRSLIHWGIFPQLIRTTRPIGARPEKSGVMWLLSLASPPLPGGLEAGSPVGCAAAAPRHPMKIQQPRLVHCQATMLHQEIGMQQGRGWWPPLTYINPQKWSSVPDMDVSSNQPIDSKSWLLAALHPLPPPPWLSLASASVPWPLVPSCSQEKTAPCWSWSGSGTCRKSRSGYWDKQRSS